MENKDKIMVVYNGKVCYMIWNAAKREWEYIPER